MEVCMPEQLPHNIEAEQATLGALLIDPEWAWHKASKEIGADDLYVGSHRILWDAIAALHKAKTRVDFVTLCDVLDRTNNLEEVGGAAFITGLVNATPTAVNIEYYTKIVRNTAILRKQIALAGELAKLAYNYEGDDPHAVTRLVTRKLLDLARQGESHAKVYAVEDVLIEVAEEQDAIAAGDVELRGFDPVLPSLKRAVWQGLWHPKSIVLIGANPGVGKSMTMLSQAVFNVVTRGQRGIYVGTEMPVKMLGYRLAPMLAHQLQVMGLTNTLLEEAQAGDLVRAVADLIVQKCARHLLLVDSATTAEEFALIVQAEEAGGEPLDFVVLDYLQMLDSETQQFRSHYDLMNYVAETVRQTTIGNDTVLIAASAFTKGSKTEKPTQERFKETSKFSHDASVMIGIYLDLMGQLNMVHCKVRTPSAKGSLEGMDIPIRIDPNYGVVQEVNTEDKEIVDIPGF
jgi:replicative DNA helicase